MANDPTTVNNSNLVVGGIGFVSAAALTLATFGTFFHQGNLVSLQQYTTARLLNGTVGISVTTQTGSTATGGLKSGGTLGNYQAIVHVIPSQVVN